MICVSGKRGGGVYACLRYASVQKGVAVFMRAYVMFSMIISFHFSHILLCCFVRNTYYRPTMAIAAPPRHIPLFTEPQGFDFLEVVSTRRKCEALGLLPGQVKSFSLGKDPSGNGYRSLRWENNLHVQVHCRDETHARAVASYLGSSMAKTNIYLHCGGMWVWERMFGAADVVVHVLSSAWLDEECHRNTWRVLLLFPESAWKPCTSRQAAHF